MPVVDGGVEATVRAEHKGFREAAARGGISLQERHAFTTLFNGFSVAVKPSELGKLRRMAGVKSLTPVVSIPMPQVQVSSPELFTALAMTGADVAQSLLGITGRGIRVGVIDTGIDYDNADLGGSGVAASNSHAFPNKRVVTGWDFVGDAYNADYSSPAFNPTMTPDAFPDDCAGHGTHVAGIIGAKGVVTGVAPDVTFGAYRVFGCVGSTSADAKDVRAFLLASAEPRLWSLAPQIGILDGVARQGAGLLQIDQAITTPVTIEPAKLALGETRGKPFSRQVKVTNIGPTTLIYDLSYENTLSVAGTFVPAFWGSDATVTFSTPSITLRVGGEAEFKVTITAPTDPDKGLYGGYIVFTPRGGGDVKRVPYAGFVGDYQSIQVMTPTVNGFPWLAGLYAGQYYGPITGPADWSYTMVGEDIPFFLVHLDHPSRLFNIDIYDEVGSWSARHPPTSTCRATPRPPASLAGPGTGWS